MKNMKLLCKDNGMPEVEFPPQYWSVASFIYYILFCSTFRKNDPHSQWYAHPPAALRSPVYTTALATVTATMPRQLCATKP